MKRVFFIFLVLISCNLSATSEKPRNQASFDALTRGAKKEKSRIFTTEGYPHYKEVSLKNIKQKKLNDIERGLIERYSDVVISKLFRCYFTISEDGNIGVVDLYGTELIPPVPGKIRQCGTFLLIGDLSDDFDDIHNLVQYENYNANYKVAYPIGFCKSVLTIFGKTVGTVIPYDAHRYISAIPLISRVRGFYICESDDYARQYWGYYDNHGNEVLACKYKSILYDGKNFVGNNTRTMEDVVADYESVINIQDKKRQQRAQLWGNILTATGESLAAASELLPSKNPENNYSNSSADNSKKNQSGSGTRHSAAETLSMQQDADTYSKYETLLINMNTYYDETYSDKLRKDYQLHMKQLRTKWESRGFNMYHSKWEEWNGVKDSL